MHLTSKSASLVILAVTSIVCSRALFWFFNDPEGPNLVIVLGMAAIVYGVSWAISRYIPPVASFTGGKRLSLTIIIQILLVTIFYFLLR
jgi:hypothetical protein